MRHPTDSPCEVVSGIPSPLAVLVSGRLSYNRAASDAMLAGLSCLVPYSYFEAATTARHEAQK